MGAGGENLIISVSVVFYFILFFKYLFIYLLTHLFTHLFIWLRRVLVVARGIFVAAREI